MVYSQFVLEEDRLSLYYLVHPHFYGNEFYHTIISFLELWVCKGHLGCASFNGLGPPISK